MADTTLHNASSAAPVRRDIGIKKRYAAERRFRMYGQIAIAFGLLFLALLLWSVVSKGYTAFEQTSINLDINFDEKIIDPKNKRASDDMVLLTANYPKLAEAALYEKLGISDDDKKSKKFAKGLLSKGTRTQLRNMLVSDPSILGTTQNVWVLATAEVDSAVKGQFDLSVDESRRKIKDAQITMIDTLKSDGSLKGRFNTGLFTNGGSSRAETAGLGVAMIGSFYMMLIVLLTALPIGVAASIYLEEFAPKNKFTDLIEVNINNLAAVPSIVYGLLGLSVFINFAGLPRSASLVGGLVLALMTLPTIIIATRAALKAVPPSIRSAALGIGASKNQTIFQHVLPLAAPGILTGTIIGLAQALGETAPLLLIGMVAFVVDTPATPLDPSTALPVQIYMWSNEAERAFVERTSGAIIVLLAFLAVMNITAIFYVAASSVGGKEMSNIMKADTDNETMAAIGGSDMPKIKMAGKGVNVFYGAKQAIFDVNLDVREKEVTALIGPSGCGKSTFLRCLNRMNDTIDICKVTGSLTLDDENIYDPSIDVVELRARVGMVFQKPNPFPKSIYENITYGPRIHGLAKSKTDLDEIVEKSLRGAGLWEEAKDRLQEPGTGLSGGQQQRLCIARAIAVAPEVILMDEPCSALDPIATAIVEELISELRNEYTIAIVTHSMQQAARVSQRTAMFHLGELVEVDDTETMFTNPSAKRTQDYITGRFG